jgi:SET and MYND domain-containing protein
MHPHVLPTNSRAVLRIVLLKAAKKLSQGDLEIFEKQLQSHIKDIERTDQKRFQMISLSAEAVRTYSKTNLSLETLRDYFGKV